MDDVRTPNCSVILTLFRLITLKDLWTKTRMRKKPTLWVKTLPLQWYSLFYLFQLQVVLSHSQEVKSIMTFTLQNSYTLFLYLLLKNCQEKLHASLNNQVRKTFSFTRCYRFNWPFDPWAFQPMHLPRRILDEEQSKSWSQTWIRTVIPWAGTCWENSQVLHHKEVKDLQAFHSAALPFKFLQEKCRRLY